MVKKHNIKLKITNGTGSSLKYHGEWFDSGRLADGFRWPELIQDGGKETVLCYERDWAMAGCSGYVQYRINGQVLTIGFSNPSAGKNKVGVGLTGKKIWDEMGCNDYSPHVTTLQMETFVLKCHYSCTGGATNNIDIVLENIENRVRDVHPLKVEEERWGSSGVPIQQESYSECTESTIYERKFMNGY
ncbi:uncharacterized protein [Clytia hemisphaerica]